MYNRLGLFIFQWVWQKVPQKTVGTFHSLVLYLTATIKYQILLKLQKNYSAENELREPQVAIFYALNNL